MNVICPCFEALLCNQDEPYMKPGLADLKNAVVVPHIASASKVIQIVHLHLRIYALALGTFKFHLRIIQKTDNVSHLY